MSNGIQRKSPTVFPYRGKWRIQYVDPSGRNRTKTAATKKDAYRELVNLEQQMALGLVDRPSHEIPTLSSWLETWLASRESEVRSTTYLGFESTIRLHIRPHIGGLRLDLVRVQDVERAYRVLANESKLSPATIRKVNAVLNQAYSTAVRYGYVVRNPMDGVRIPRGTTVKRQTLTSDEVRRILDSASAADDDSYPRLLLALRLGMRQGECLALTWADVDLAEGLVRISKSVDVLPGRGAVVTAPKSAQSFRDIPMDDETLSAFSDFLLRSGVPGGDELVFPSLKGRHRNARVDYDNWKRALMRAGVRSVRLHDARHAAATLLLESGADPRTVQLLLGHSSAAFTLSTYVHPDLAALRRAIGRVAELG